MFQYRLLSHDGEGNFRLIEEFRADREEEAERVAARWAHVRQLELWRSGRKVKRWD